MDLTRTARYVALAVVAVLVATMGINGGVSETWTTPRARGQSNDTRLRLAFYYPWLPDHWQENGIYPLTHYHPALGYYDSSDAIVIRKHIDAMQYARIDAAIASWWGRDNRYGTDVALRRILKESRDSGFRWAVYYEWEGPVDNIPRDPSRSEIVSDLDYLYANFANDPSYLHIDGRWVLFVYSDDTDGCGMVSRWTEAMASHPEAYVVLRVFHGYTSCAAQPDGWHQYSVNAYGFDSQQDYSYYSYTIQPGFWSAVKDCPRLERDLARWKENIRNMISSGATFQLVSTFNEWGEGTPVESATEWATPSGYGAYLDALHSSGDINVSESTNQGTGGGFAPVAVELGVGVAIALAAIAITVKMSKPKREASSHCRYCGKRISSNSRFCQFCGGPLPNV
jgi:hypothetical protein